MHAKSHSKQEHYLAQDDELFVACHRCSPERKNSKVKTDFEPEFYSGPVSSYNL
jgi:hypothetical protein